MGLFKDSKLFRNKQEFVEPQTQFDNDSIDVSSLFNKNELSNNPFEKAAPYTASCSKNNDTFGLDRDVYENIFDKDGDINADPHRQKCEALRQIRLNMAKTLGIPEIIRNEPCNYQGICKGTCPACYMEERALMDRAYELYENGIIQMTYNNELKELQQAAEIYNANKYTMDGLIEGDISMSDDLISQIDILIEQIKDGEITDEDEIKERFAEAFEEKYGYFYNTYGNDGKEADREKMYEQLMEIKSGKRESLDFYELANVENKLLKMTENLDLELNF